MMTLEYIVQYAKQTGFIYQGSEIYGGLANTYDYGPLGMNLKKNIKDAWLKRFLREGPDIIGLDSSILLNSKVWEASGHLVSFSDPLIENKDSNARYRADKLITNFDPSVNPDGWTDEQMFSYIIEHNIQCPISKTTNWLPIRKFNLMFETKQGVVADSLSTIYLRPETAQGIFINFKNLLRTSRKKIPFGVAQVGKSFRNEITPGNFIFRTREFEQMELEFFCKPGTELTWFNFFKEYMMKFLTDLGLNPKHLRFDDHKKEALAFYSNATTDIQYNYPWGFDELWGLASRTDYDLTQHAKLSKVDLTYQDPETNEKYTPYVVEPAVGVERLVLAFIADALDEELLDDGQTRQILRIHPALAPYKAVILPLMKKEHSPLAKEIYQMLSKHFDCQYDETQNIGKRYRRADAIGVPFAITVDQQTLEDETVTLRDRDTMKQKRIKISRLKNYIEKAINF